MNISPGVYCILYCVYFLYIFGGLVCVGHSFAYVAHFCIFERCLDSNPERCRCKQMRYLLYIPRYCIYLPCLKYMVV